MVHEKRFGKVKKAEFHFVAKDPVPHGQDPKNGKVDIEVVYRNGKTWSLTGTFDEGMLDATITGPEGNTLSVQWEKNGKSKESTPL